MPIKWKLKQILPHTSWDSITVIAYTQYWAICRPPSLSGTGQQKNLSLCPILLDHYSAVRFTKAQRGHDAKPGTTFNSGEESFSAEYDWYFQGDGSGDFTQSGVLSGHEQLARKPLKGIGRFAFQTGQIYVKCGPFKLRWMFPTRVAFYSTGVTPGDYGIELAPTKWAEIKEVDVLDPRLKWYRYDANRKSVEIPLNNF